MPALMLNRLAVTVAQSEFTSKMLQNVGVNEGACKFGVTLLEREGNHSETRNVISRLPRIIKYFVSDLSSNTQRKCG